MMTPTNHLAQTPAPPYYVAIFSSKRADGDRGYSSMADRMEELAKTMPGYLGIESVRDDSGMGTTVSYWQTAEDILHWKQTAKGQR